MAYTARTTPVDGVDTVQLADTTREVQLAIAPSVGNMAYSWTVRGRNYLYFPYTTVGEFAKQPRLCAVPFLGPWANRLDSDGFWANGVRYNLGRTQEALGNNAEAIKLYEADTSPQRDGNRLRARQLKSKPPSAEAAAPAADAGSN